MEIEFISHTQTFTFVVADLVWYRVLLADCNSFCNYKNIAIKSTININYIHAHKTQRCLTHPFFFPITNVFEHESAGRERALSLFRRWILMENNNNLLSFGLRCGDSRSILARRIPYRQRMCRNVCVCGNRKTEETNQIHTHTLL